MGGMRKMLVCGACFVAALCAVWAWGYRCGEGAAAMQRRTRPCEAAAVRTETVATRRAVRPSATGERRAGAVTVPVRVTLRKPEEPSDLPDNTILIFTPEKNKKDTLRNKNGQEWNVLAQEKNDIALNDTLRAVVPLTQKTYKDSLYTAWVSGYMPRLDSIEVYNKVVTYTRTETRSRRFGVGIVGGVGYGMLSRKPDVWVGVGVTWNVFKR